MAIVPKSIDKRIAFYASRLNLIFENADALRLDPLFVAQFAAEVQAAQDAYRQQAMAQRAAQTATQELNQSVVALSRTGASIVQHVRSVARTDPSILALAAIPPTKTRSEIPRPGTPTRLTTTIDGVGNIKLMWTCKNPRGSEGTQYRLYRRASSNVLFEMIGQSGLKQFVDATVPRGHGAAVQDRIDPRRQGRRRRDLQRELRQQSPGGQTRRHSVPPQTLSPNRDDLSRGRVNQDRRRFSRPGATARNGRTANSSARRSRRRRPRSRPNR